jgi:hypothetical protein
MINQYHELSQQFSTSLTIVLLLKVTGGSTVQVVKHLSSMAVVSVPQGFTL